MYKYLASLITDISLPSTPPCTASPPPSSSSSRASWSISVLPPAGWTRCRRRTWREVTKPQWRGGTRPKIVLFQTLLSSWLMTAGRLSTISGASNLIVSAPSIISIKLNTNITTVEQSQPCPGPPHDRIIAQSATLGWRLTIFND